MEIEFIGDVTYNDYGFIKEYTIDNIETQYRLSIEYNSLNDTLEVYDSSNRYDPCTLESILDTFSIYNTNNLRFLIERYSPKVKDLLLKCKKSIKKKEIQFK